LQEATPERGTVHALTGRGEQHLLDQIPQVLVVRALARPAKAAEA
jgi:hypothetical protein